MCKQKEETTNHIPIHRALASWLGSFCGKEIYEVVKDDSFMPGLMSMERESRTFEDSGLWEMLPKGTCSLLVQPVLQIPSQGTDEMEKIDGFVLLASSMNFAYTDKDRAWIGAVANKFRDGNAAPRGSNFDMTEILVGLV
ncbi:Protein cofactor assembly of complex C subunit B CCB2, chloroplastic [Vitis vinifera]|uniref:Protein cofactor assembly of complex C subunit B CCB2, chloroplastic n=1 Tax=Vitis vinifera TaxID=29760 RepID=A0A438GWN9_VITVI|nr:Protein cofactor assembly of complex C subunit B CCB2, chloroplastic [Vitis vinifera]